MTTKFIKLEKGYAISYENDLAHGSIANTGAEPLEISLFEYPEDILFTYLVNGIFTQIWVKEYKIKRIGSDE